MSSPAIHFPVRKLALGISTVALLVAIVVFGPTLIQQLRPVAAGSAASEEGSGESQHDHAHAGHDSAAEIELSPQALKNIDHQPLTVALGEYEKTISLPGMVVERPGRSQIRISAPLGGIITKVYVIQGEAIAADTQLFEIRLTHEELVSAQGELLKTVEQLDVVNQEIKRLEAITEGVVPGRRIVEQKYERQKLEAQVRAQRQSLLLHGLSEAQVDEIDKNRHLLKSLTIRAPSHEDDEDCRGDHWFHIQSLDVQLGQQVAAGDLLAVIADHCELYIEGTAFEDDAERLREAAATGAYIRADVLRRDQREHAIGGLKLLYISDQVDRESRAQHFYLKLPNAVVLDRKDGPHRFLQWRFKPGQRVELQVPVEKWEQRIVLPADAVVGDGAESYVYQQHGKHFRRVPVHVEFRDQKTVIIANDGSVFPGDVIAGKGAFQIHLALKNKSGGAIDPHAGHSH
jgi:cobalt-zinc-cadmium efflux system membrane fusion protein